MRRTALVLGLLVLTAAAATASRAMAQPTAAAPSDVAADFNDDGVAGLAIGVPGEDDIAGRSTYRTGLAVG